MLSHSMKLILSVIYFGQLVPFCAGLNQTHPEIILCNDPKIGHSCRVDCNCGKGNSISVAFLRNGFQVELCGYLPNIFKCPANDEKTYEFHPGFFRTTLDIISLGVFHGGNWSCSCDNVLSDSKKLEVYSFDEDRFRVYMEQPNLLEHAGPDVLVMLENSEAVIQIDVGCVYPTPEVNVLYGLYNLTCTKPTVPTGHGCKDHEQSFHWECPLIGRDVVKVNKRDETFKPLCSLLLYGRVLFKKQMNKALRIKSNDTNKDASTIIVIRVVVILMILLVVAAVITVRPVRERMKSVFFKWCCRTEESQGIHNGQEGVPIPMPSEKPSSEGTTNSTDTDQLLEVSNYEQNSEGRYDDNKFVGKPTESDAEQYSEDEEEREEEEEERNKSSDRTHKATSDEALHSANNYATQDAQPRRRSPRSSGLMIDINS